MMVLSGFQLEPIDQWCLQAVAQLKDAYCRSIHAEVQRATGLRVSQSQVYQSLDRLEFQGLLESSIGYGAPMDGVQRRSNRQRRYFTVTEAGKAL